MVSTPAQADLLLDPEQFRLLEALMQGPTTVATLAEAQRLKVGQVHYRLGKLRAAGLIDIAFETKRHGRAIKHYAAVSRHYQIPFELVSAATRTELLLGMIQPHLTTILGEQARQLDAVRAPIHIYLSRSGQIDINQEGEDSGIGTWGTVHLTPALADELTERLRELLRWLVPQTQQLEADTPGTRPYTLALLLSEGDAYGE